MDALFLLLSLPQGSHLQWTPHESTEIERERTLRLMPLYVVLKFCCYQYLSEEIIFCFASCCGADPSIRERVHDIYCTDSQEIRLHPKDWTPHKHSFYSIRSCIISFPFVCLVIHLCKTSVCVQIPVRSSFFFFFALLSEFFNVYVDTFPCLL